MAALTARQSRFVSEYLRDLNATAAALRAGYSHRSARQTGAENLSKPAIAAAIRSAMDERAQAAGIDARQVLDALAAIAFSNIRDLFASDGKPLPLDQIAPEHAAAIQSIRVTLRKNADGEEIQIVDIRLSDKLTALDRLARHLGMFPVPVQRDHEAENPVNLLIREMQGTRG